MVTVNTEIMNGMDLKSPSNTFDVSCTSFALFAFPDTVDSAYDLHRTCKSHGMAALTAWKTFGWIPFPYEVARRIRPGREFTRFLLLDMWSVPGKLAETLREGGFWEVEDGEVKAYAFWESLEVAAGKLSETLRMMAGKRWREGFREVMREGGRVGVEMVAWTGVGRK